MESYVTTGHQCSIRVLVKPVRHSIHTSFYSHVPCSKFKANVPICPRDDDHDDDDDEEEEEEGEEKV